MYKRQVVPAAIGGVVTPEVAEALRCRVLVEAANGPTTADAHDVLCDRDVTVVPDILANAGGVTGSYFEWTMNIQQFKWKLSQFNDELADRLCAAYDRTQAFAENHECTLRQAAYAIGVQRVADASRMRGYV